MSLNTYQWVFFVAPGLWPEVDHILRDYLTATNY